MNFKEIADSITERSELEDALRRVYDQGVSDEHNRWWADLEMDESYQLYEQAALIALRQLEKEETDGYLRCCHNPGSTDDKQ